MFTFLCLFMWKVDSVHKNKLNKKQAKCVCGTDKRHKPEGSFTWRSQPFIFPQTHLLISTLAHTKEDNLNPHCVIHTTGSLKESVCLHFYSRRSRMRAEYESRWLRLQRWLMQIRWPLVYSCYRSCVSAHLDVWSWSIHTHQHTVDTSRLQTLKHGSAKPTLMISLL